MNKTEEPIIPPSYAIIPPIVAFIADIIVSNWRGMSRITLLIPLAILILKPLCNVGFKMKKYKSCLICILYNILFYIFTLYILKKFNLNIFTFVLLVPVIIFTAFFNRKILHLILLLIHDTFPFLLTPYYIISRNKILSDKAIKLLAQKLVNKKTILYNQTTEKYYISKENAMKLYNQLTPPPFRNMNFFGIILLFISMGLGFKYHRNFILNFFSIFTFIVFCFGHAIIETIVIIIIECQKKRRNIIIPPYIEENLNLASEAHIATPLNLHNLLHFIIETKKNNLLPTNTEHIAYKKQNTIQFKEIDIELIKFMVLSRLKTAKEEVIEDKEYTKGFNEKDNE